MKLKVKLNFKLKCKKVKPENLCVIIIPQTFLNIFLRTFVISLLDYVTIQGIEISETKYW